ncbi:E-selectin isoform X2 [Melanotaenia boesemani]|uniref:E-selectin isoform X2 n=1 Tax=Melanotaenia boesemani TaxID=1250792 RepID=UPI001C03EC0E|nr:E-selectin isoform X2 [Melanotaenia boesemani]
MEFNFGFFSGCKSYVSWIRLFLLYSILCMWTSVECWSYFYSDTTMNWAEARTWCREHYTDMVAIQNQKEIEHLNSWLPMKQDYYWIGIRKIDDIWTWVGTNKALTEEATNWAKNEPNNGMITTTGNSEDCVEMYIKRSRETGKWNDEWCGKKKTALCYAAACKNDSCAYGECVETVNNHKCECFPGFYGERCEQVVKCSADELIIPDKGNLSCTHTYGEFTYDSSCQYSCEEGYQLSVPRPLRCTATGNWSEPPPTCKLVQCQELSQSPRGSIECFDPLGSFSYQSTCIFTCDQGYELNDSLSNTLQCESSGNWNSSQPSCIPVQCSTLQDLENGIVTCENDTDMTFSYGKTCSFSCAHGYRLAGASRVTCTSAAEWSEQMPQCEAITCQNPEGEAHLITDCGKRQTELKPSSTCSFSCEPGFELQGAHITICSEDGLWSEAIPTCKAVQCSAVQDLKNGIVNCEDGTGMKFSYGNTCSFSCEQGFELQGAHITICSEDGQWSEALPVCKAVQCSAVQDLQNGVVKCEGGTGMKFSYGNTCSFSCEQGFELQGANTTICSEDGQWSEAMPICSAIRCPHLEAPENGNMTCSKHEPVFSSQCSFTCDQDFALDGHELLTCVHNGSWSGKKPTCQAVLSRNVTTAIVAAGGSVLGSGLLMSLWILKQLRKRTSKFELNSNSSDIDLL